MLGAALLVGPAARGNPRFDSTAALDTSQAAIGRILADRTFTDEYGRPLQLSELRGRPLVVSFVFTNCQYVCSSLTLHLRDVVRIARDALGDRSFAVLTVGFDAARDTPRRMREFAFARGIGDAQWRVASADPATIRLFTADAGFTWLASPNGFDHLAQVTLVDTRGRVAAQVYGDDFEPPALVEPLKQLVLERGIDQSALRDLAVRARLWCSVYDPVTRRYRFDYSMLFGLLPAMLVLAIVATAILDASRKQR
jgi:protein SCO1/2